MSEQLIAYFKCIRVINSCKDVTQAIVASKLVDNFAKSFGRGKLWLDLEYKSTSNIFNKMKGEH